MAAFDFPNSPSVNDTYSANGMTFTWNGTKWERTSPSVGAQGSTGPAVDLSQVIMLNTYSVKEESGLSNEQLEWQKARSRRKITKMDFEIR